jgi:uncharacterized membrane protein
VSLLLAAVLAAQPGPQPEQYRAIGVGPFWRVDIGRNIMVFETPGREIVTIDMPPRRETELGFSHMAPEMRLDAEHRDCRDPLTGRIHRDAVTVEQGGTTFRGCGGPVQGHARARADYFAGGSEPFWSLDIADGRMTYRIDGEVIIVRTPASRSRRDGSLRVYETRNLTVSLANRHCEDEGARLYANSVSVRVRGRTVRGCGGRVIREPPED